MFPSLTEAFLAGLSELNRPPWGAVQALETKLAAFIAACQAAWTALDVDPRVFLRHVAACCPEGQPPDPAFPFLNGPDLYLAVACVSGNAAALSSFEQQYLRHVPNMLASLKPAPDLVEEVQQQLRVQLLAAPPGDLPKLAEYSGRGALIMWLRSVSVRTALNLLNRADYRKRVDLPTEDAGLLLGAVGADMPEPERALLIKRSREAVQQAFLAALASLPQQQRTLMRLHYLDGRTLEEIGLIYHVHKATISRRLEAARSAVRDELRRQLQERLRLSVSAIDSLVQSVTSQLEVSLSWVFRSSVEP